MPVANQQHNPNLTSINKKTITSNNNFMEEEVKEDRSFNDLEENE